MIGFSILAIYFIASLFLFSYSVNCYVLILFYLRRFRKGNDANHKLIVESQTWWNNPERVPRVTTQVPLYNELNVAERVIRAVAAMDYPEGKHEIQILDDSTDETKSLVDQVVSTLKSTGLDIHVVRRSDRVGFKAGALDAGTRIAKGEFLAVFDGDFVPKPDFLKKMVPFFLNDGKVGLVQARWGHLNKEDSMLTRTQSLGIDGHFIIEQSARAFTGLFMNFNGTAGMWRKQTIVEAGGWKHDTLTEDLDLSYRAQLAGWKASFVPEVVVPAELPNNVAAFKSQQFRWAKGSIQTALKLLPALGRSDLSCLQKVQGFFHLTHFAIHPFMVILALLGLPFSVVAESQLPTNLFFTAGLIMSLATFAPCTLYWFSQKHTGIPWHFRLIRIPLLMITGVGIAISNARAVIEALIGKQSDFIRTPKMGNAPLKTYRVKMPILPLLEIALSGYCWYSVFQFFPLGKWFVAPFLFINALGFGYIGFLGLMQSWRPGNPLKRFKWTKLESAPA